MAEDPVLVEFKEALIILLEISMFLAAFVISMTLPEEVVFFKVIPLIIIFCAASIFIRELIVEFAGISSITLVLSLSEDLNVTVLIAEEPGIAPIVNCSK